MALLLSTTGSPATVILYDLGARTFVHPTTNLDLEAEYSLYELLNSDDLQNSLNNAEITLTFDGASVSYNQFLQLARGNMQKSAYDFNEDNLVDTAGFAGTSGYAGYAINSAALNGQTSTYYLNRSNHTGTITTDDISDFDTAVASAVIAASGTSGFATYSGYANDADKLDNQQGTFYLSRANHTGTQTAATISDFNSAVLAITGGTSDYASTSGYALSAASAYTALNSDNANLLQNQNGTYYLSRANHTGTQTAATISDFTSAARGTLSVDLNSTQYLNYNSSTGEFSISALAITDVTVNNTATSLEQFVLTYTGANFQEGDVVILTAIPTGTEVYIHNGSYGTAGAIGDFTLIQAPNLSNTYIRSLFSATGPLQYNNLTGAFSITQSSGSSDGYLSSTDWTTFNNKLGTSSSIDALADVDTTTVAPVSTNLFNFNGTNWVPIAVKSVNVRHSWSITSGVSGNATNRYTDWNGGAMNLSSYIVPVNATIIHISAATNGAFTWTAEARVNGAVASSLSISAADSGFNTVSVNVNAGDKISMYVNGSSINRPNISVMMIER